jgi:hypothetical protein
MVGRRPSFRPLYALANLDHRAWHGLATDWQRQNRSGGTCGFFRRTQPPPFRTGVRLTLGDNFILLLSNHPAAGWGDGRLLEEAWDLLQMAHH